MAEKYGGGGHIPQGGKKNQVLRKASDDAFDTEWVTPTGDGTGAASVDWQDVENKPAEFPPEPHRHDAQDIDNLPNNGGGYEPPAGGIPRTDLTQDVQDSLAKADTALQDVAWSDIDNKPSGMGLPATIPNLRWLRVEGIGFNGPHIVKYSDASGAVTTRQCNPLTTTPTNITNLGTILQSTQGVAGLVYEW